MQTKLIKTNAEYAYAKSYEWNNRYGTRRRAERVLVLETAVPRKAWGTYGSTSTKDGVKVRWLDRDGQGEGVIASRDIREEWATYKPAADEAEKRERESRLATIAYQKAMAKRLDALWARLPEDTQRPWFARVTDGKPAGNAGEVSNDTLATLLEAALKAGWSEGWDARAADEQDEEA